MKKAFKKMDDAIAYFNKKEKEPFEPGYQISIYPIYYENNEFIVDWTKELVK